ncbi:MAG: putative SAM-dependent methyltransferase, partial [Verrucomicrobiaceae bacterium]|nr:putative SAM-dependent methyltransferase [Verrucomicrobiaceae bacterium]
MSLDPVPAPKLSSLRLRVTAKTEGIVRKGHPWVYSDSIAYITRDGDIGEVGIIYDKKDKFLAVGLYDPLSPIRFRVLQAGKAVKVDRDFWINRMRAAKERRAEVFDEGTNAHRWISGESDGFPGLVVDRYVDVLVLKLYSAVWLPRLGEMVECLREVFAPSAIVLRLSRNIQEIARTRWQTTEGCIVGETENLVVFRENDVLMEAEVIRGQKTGFFLDQRDNR